MQTLNKVAFQEYINEKPQSETGIHNFVALLEGCSAKNPHELKETFGKFDCVPNPGGLTYYVFDVKGGDTRVVAHIDFKEQVAFVALVMNHADYDKWSDKGRKNRR